MTAFVHVPRRMEQYGQDLNGQDLRTDQRREERNAINIPATIFSSDGKRAIATTIVERSESGAKLKVDGYPSLPRVILLADFSNNSIFECQVRWRHLGHVGVQIIDVFGPARRRRFFKTHTAPKSQGLTIADETAFPAILTAAILLEARIRVEILDVACVHKRAVMRREEEWEELKRETERLGLGGRIGEFGRR